MKIYYDFHIHSALSPCGDEDMTPNNIVNMSLLKGLNAIAVTDHNSALNVRAVCECGEKAGLIVVPAMEVETSEEVHIVAMFPVPDAAERLGEIVSDRLPVIKNRTDIFGNQTVLNSDDEIVAEVPNLLATATTLSLDETVRIINELGGIAIPAHVDKSSYSIISNLGFIPPELHFSTLEMKFPDKKAEFLKEHNLSGFNIIHNSDAHFLWDIHEKEFFIESAACSARGIIDYLKQKN